MARDERLGSVSGKPYFPVGGDGLERAEERTIGDDVSAGMTKFYRRAFLDDIGGLVKGLIWDGIDCYRGRMLGWRSNRWTNPNLRFIHLRPMGSSDRGIMTGRRGSAKAIGFSAQRRSFVIASAVYRLRHKPALVGSLGTLQGYARAWLNGAPRYDDPRVSPVPTALPPGDADPGQSARSRVVRPRSSRRLGRDGSG